MAIDVVAPVASAESLISLKAQSRQASLEKSAVPAKNRIYDIRHEAVEYSILDDIDNGLVPEAGGEKTLPTLLLYDAAGLKLFERITYLDEYYLTNAEIQVLENYADRIAERIQPEALVVELGSGNLRKVNILLEALDRVGKNVEYYALDLSLTELERTLSEIPEGAYKSVQCFGLQGTYEDGLRWLKRPERQARPKTILHLGSSIGNFTRPAAAKFLGGFAEGLRTGDSMLIGIDGCKDAEKVFHAYNDREGVTHEFILNGLVHANRILGWDVFDLAHWQVIGESDGFGGYHQAFVSPKRDVEIMGTAVRAGERIRIEQSYKYSAKERKILWEESGLAEGASWSNDDGDYSLHMVTKPSFSFSMRPEVYAATSVPRLLDWQAIWAAWDAVTQNMIPEEGLLSKPITLRNACIFYLGHIPTFLDIHVSNASGQPLTEPRTYPLIFERGIDPDVNNPDCCHAHSEIPDHWPPVKEIHEFQTRVRERVKGFYLNGRGMTDVKLGRSLWLAFEHELMHLETLLYMLIQSEKIITPPGVITPDFEVLARQAEASAVPNEWFTIPKSTVALGVDDEEKHFGWDNEKPRRQVVVNKFITKARPITVGEYAQHLLESGSNELPASWSVNKPSTATTEVNGYAQNGHSSSLDTLEQFASNKSAKTLWGLIPLKYAFHWPVMASFDELARCASSMGGRVPTMGEVRSLYNYAEQQKALEADGALEKKIPAVNGHLVNDGVEESPPQGRFTNGSSDAVSSSSTLPARDLFVDLDGANVGFKHWHPLPVTQSGGKLSGQSDFGGVWEWTSTVLEEHVGFRPMELYPGYTADFFDKKHNIVLGGSWATHPRIAGRKTFVNWYQRNYPFAWAGARLVRDA